MDLDEAIYHRRAVREYTDQPVNPSLINELLRAAVHAPSAMNQQPWAFAVINDRERLRQCSNRTKAHLLASLTPPFELHPRTELYANPDDNLFHRARTLIAMHASSTRIVPSVTPKTATANFPPAAS